MSTSYDSTPTVVDPIDALDSVINELMDVEDWEETTQVQAVPSVHVHLDSKPDSDPPGKPPKSIWGALRWALVALGTGAALAMVQALQTCTKR